MTPTENLPSSQSHQSFRLRGSNSSADEVRIVIRKDTTSGQNFVLWNDILNVFRNAGHVQHGSDVVPYMTDNQFEYLRPLRIETYPGIVLEVVLVSVLVFGQDPVASPIPSWGTLLQEQGNNTLEEQLRLAHIGTQRPFADGSTQRDLDTSMPPPYEITASTPSSSSSSSSSQRISTTSTQRPTSVRTLVQHRISTAISPPLELSTATSPSAAAGAEAAATWLTADEEPAPPTPRAGGRPSRASQQFIARVQSILLDSTHQLEVYEQSILSEPSARSDFLIRGVATIQQGLDSIHQELHDVVPTLRTEIAKNTTLQLQILEMQTAADEMARRMLEMQQHAIGLQEQTLDRLATIQGRVSAILTQTYELHEYPIPRLFIILPKEDGTRTEALRNVFAKQFKLYFLCECNNHSRHSGEATTTVFGTNSQGMTMMPRQEIHLARHEGYDLDRPTEFFEKYGSYVLTLLQMLKYGAVVAGVVIPPLAQFRIADGLDTAKQSADALYSGIEPKVDSAIEYLQGLSSSNMGPSPTTENTSTYEDSLEALEGADLRQLSSFLKINDEGRVLGNLYRTVTGEGHVKWVCLDHYRETYGLSAQRGLREVVESSRGRYDEPTGTVSIELISPVQARQFYSILATSRYVQELRLTMSWDTTSEDYRSLKEALQQSNVIRLELVGNMTSGPKTDILNRTRRHDPFLQLMAGGKLKMLSIRGVKDFFERTSKVPSIIHIRTFELQSSVVTSKDGPQLEKLVLVSPMLYELVLLVQDIDAMFALLSPLIKKLKRFRTLTLHQVASRTAVNFQYDPADTDDKAPIISLRGDGIESTKLALIHRVRKLTIQKYQETHQIQELISRVVKKHQSSLEVVEIKCLADHFPLVTDWFHREIKGYGHKTLRQFVLHDGFNSVVICDFQNSKSLTSKLELEEISTCESDNPAQNLTTLFERHGSEIKVLDLDHNFTQLQASKFLQSVRQAQGATKLRTLTWDITKTWDGRIFRDMLPALRMCDPTVLQWVSIKINQGYRDVFQNHQLQQPPQAGIITVLDDQSGSSGRENLGMILKKKANRLELRARGLNVIVSKLQTACNGIGGPFEQLEELYIRGFEEKFGGRSVKWVQSLMQRDISIRQQQQLSVPASQVETDVDTRPLSMSSDTKMSGSPATPNPAAAVVPVKPLAAFKRLTSVTLFHVLLVPLSWELLINSIDFLTIRHLDFTLTNFADSELYLLTRRCLSKVKKCREIQAEDERAGLSCLGVEEWFAVEDLKEQEKFGLMVWLDRTEVSQATVRKLRGEVEEAKCCWLKFDGLEALAATAATMRSKQ